MGRIYPKDQVKYLLIDVILLVFLLYKVAVTDSDASPFLILGLMFVYLICFYICLWETDWRLAFGSLAGFAVIACLAVFIDKWALMYGFTFAHLLGRAEKKSYIVIGIAAILLMFLSYSQAAMGSPFAFAETIELPFMIIQLLLPVLVRIQRKTTELQGELNTANARIRRMEVEEERYRIARDLHDTIGQSLTMIKFKTELTKRMVEKNNDGAIKELDEILDTARTALRQVREVVSDMKHISLADEMEQSRILLAANGIRLDIHMHKPITVLSPATETMLSLCVREAVTNIMKHSGAKTCDIVWTVNQNHACLRVKDDGNGRFQFSKGNGLHSIRERMEMLDGYAEFLTGPNRGTEIVCSFPILSETGVREK